MSEMIFAPEDSPEDKPLKREKKWKVLIVDDEQDIHDVTILSLNDFEFAGHSLQFLSAFSAKQAIEILNDNTDIAVALVDVVMEDEHAGLDLIKYIREELNNELIRLILRTGQPGQAPEIDVIRDYDINDYKEKTELTTQKLYSTVYTSLKSYRALVALDNNRTSLEQIISASAKLFIIPNLNQFIQGVLEQIVALLYLGEDAVYVACDCIACEHDDGESRVIAATGKFESSVGQNPSEKINAEAYQLINQAYKQKESIISGKNFAGYFQPHEGREDVIYVSSAQELNQSDLKLINLFLHNVSIAYENVLLKNEIEGTQRDMLYMLGESIETRSKETGQHVHRVAEYCRLITLGLGLSDRDAEVIEVASPLHDFGKIGIPDNILHKPGKLNEEEWELMKSHAEIGRDLLKQSDRKILKAASVIAGQHHEHWNGKGYPDGIKGEQIHIYARISAVADVFDALGSKRCYKEAWSIDKVVDLLKQQSGKQFDPVIIEWVLNNLDQMEKVRALYPD